MGEMFFELQVLSQSRDGVLNHGVMVSWRPDTIVLSYFGGCYRLLDSGAPRLSFFFTGRENVAEAYQILRSADI